LCGFRPTGRLHVGHYFSVIKPGQEGATVLVANYHAPEEKDFEDSIDCLEAFQVKDIVYQKDIFDSDLFFKLLNISNFNDLKKMTQFKSAADDVKTAQLVTYPVLMTHDIIGYKEILEA
jgi:tryptophanyl-tRNA synthetase